MITLNEKTPPTISIPVPITLFVQYPYITGDWESSWHFISESIKWKENENDASKSSKNTQTVKTEHTLMDEVKLYPHADVFQRPF